MGNDYAVNANYQTWLWEKLGEKCVKNLKKHAFDAHAMPNVDEARKFILDMISGYDTFGFGGSDTTRALGLVDTLKKKGKTVYDHWVEGLSGEENLAIRKNQMLADCFLCSANAVSAGGAEKSCSIVIVGSPSNSPAVLALTKQVLGSMCRTAAAAAEGAMSGGTGTATQPAATMEKNAAGHSGRASRARSTASPSRNPSSRSRAAPRRALSASSR